MKKILLTGTNQANIGFFFANLANEFEMITTSTRPDDFSRHIDLFTPDLIIYCMGVNLADECQEIDKLLRRLSHDEVLFGVTGDVKTGNPVYREVLNKVKLTIQTPLTMPSLKHTLNSALGIKSEDAKDSDAEHAGASADAKPSSVMFAGSDEDENRRKHILIIDDSPLVLKTVNNILKEKDDVSLARGGEPAYTYLEKNKTDLILIDYEMPGENGPSVLTNIRKMRNGQKVPAVYLTGVKDTASFMEAVKTHPQGYLLKPMDSQKLLSKLEEILLD